ncbi:MAG: hypothetical protein IH611_02630 [Deltaproteobacteria bacterium]|nr:hypothetical protein [Deltaproteobacteria bacterium]
MRTKTAFVAILTLFASMTFPGGTGECMGMRGETFVLKGTARIVGNAPFARLVLTVPAPEGNDPPKNYTIKGHLAEEIGTRHQGKVVTVECRRCEESARDLLPCIEPVKIVGVE